MAATVLAEGPVQLPGPCKLTGDGVILKTLCWTPFSFFSAVPFPTLTSELTSTQKLSDCVQGTRNLLLVTVSLHTHTASV